ncbi:MAG: hypothetical protein UW73_C0041G0010 [Microgenomates group bacterium GW2011_GWB1_44_8]|nr:MAG: hypothetical protein UW73_C0041G0010 [Microgenomates group bacterium GW2011_GWB1_44_8]
MSDYVTLSAFLISPILASISGVLFGVNLRRYLDSGKKSYGNKAIIFGVVLLFVCLLNAGIFLADRLTPS